MTKLDRLIAKLCPNGVEYKTLGDVCSLITKGTTPSSFEKKGVFFIKTEAFDGLKIDKSKLSFISQSMHEEALKRSILQENDILFAIAGSIGKCAVITKDLLPANTNQALAIIRLTENVNRNYILHMLQSQHMKEYISRSVKGSAQPNLNLQQMSNFSIPVPPLPIQQEIARLLDKFTTLEAELEAELEARKKQYEYYRNTLLTFNKESAIINKTADSRQQTADSRQQTADSRQQTADV
jgi:type I restriction enzyme S subunit